MAIEESHVTKVICSSVYRVEDVLKVEAIRSGVDTREMGFEYVINMLNKEGNLSELLHGAEDISKYFDSEIAKQSFNLLNLKFAAKFISPDKQYVTADTVQNFVDNLNLSGSVSVGIDEIYGVDSENIDPVYAHVFISGNVMDTTIKMSPEEYKKLKLKFNRVE